ncbi:MAG: phospho-N-acetylmuramoyl-pentapeptide-transferase [Candidatus Pelagibacter sp.]|nr:phospho-N-acetylmuramoyl-pentapeptide-transferase [Candidatus Pelagibacter sp.]|tara:strand:+ start:5688 stop:6773 length:1086 start_codon:yes stop_codon:yes gene_type:complete
MLYSFLTSLVDTFSFLNVFKYITFRIGLSVITSLIIIFLIGDPLIRYFAKKQITGPIRQDGPIDHIVKKSGTPTMGGLMILIGIIISTLMWADLNNIYVWIVLFVCTSLGLLGFVDDYYKIKLKNSSGINAKIKFLGQLIISLITILALFYHTDHESISNLYFPFFKNFVLHLGLFFIPFGIFVIIGSSNAVNLTDGLDGLATVPVMLVALSFALICYLVGNAIFSNYLQIQYVSNVGELSIFCGSIVGSCLGFLWYNAPPAKIFMGDTGSLSLGGSIASVAIIVKHEIVLAIVGGLFVLETVSVIIQVISFKLTGKRVFMMAPIHHHFEKKGWAESTIVIRFWIIAIILALVGLATLKLR